MNRALSIVLMSGILSVCCLAVALTEVRGHYRMGGITFAFNETPQEYTALAIDASQLQPQQIMVRK